MNFMDLRLSKLKNFLKDDTEAILIFSYVNRWYFSGLSSSDGVLLITRKQCFLLVDFRYLEMAQKAAGTLFSIEEVRKTYEDLAALLKKKSISRAYVETKGINLFKFNKLKSYLDKASVFADTSGELDKVIENIRIIKSDSEIEKIKGAQKITETVFEEILGDIVPGANERDIAFKIEFLMRSKGAKYAAFDLIALTGSKTSLPHGVPDYTKIKPGDLFQFDIGAVYEGYCSDMSRVVCVGHASDYQKEIYEIVLSAQKAALKAARSGVTAGEVDLAAREFIDSCGYKDCFGHASGHGVGIEVHEKPSVTKAEKTVLCENMVITVEPGIYISGQFGIRIEDMIVIKNDGFENLTKAPKTLLEL